MANSTVYPYGTNGSLPSSIGLINDLKTGGVDKALTAEQGKVIGDILFRNSAYSSDDLSPLSSYNDKQLKADSSQVGKALSAVTTANNSGIRNYRIPVNGAYTVTFTKYNTTAQYGCLFLDSSDKVVAGVYSVSTDPTVRTVGVPAGAYYFIWSYSPSGVSDADKRVCTVTYISTNADEERIDSLEEQVDTINDEIGKVEVTEVDYAGMTHFKDGYQLKANSSQIGKTLNNVDTSPSTGAYVNVKIPVAGYDRVSFNAYTTTVEYGSLIVDENNIVLMGVYKVSGESARKEIELPNGAAYLVYSYTTSATYDKTVTLYKSGSILSRLDSLEGSSESGSSSVNATASGSEPSLTAGRVDAYGSRTSITTYLTTEPIFGPFYIELNDGWKIYEGHLIDRAGQIVSYQYIHPEVKGINRRPTSTYRIISIENVVPEFGVRLVICKLDGSTITDATNVVKNFVSLTDAGLHKWIPDDLPNYDRALRRIEYVQSLRYVPLAKIPNGYPSSSSTSATNVQNTYFDLAGQMAVGVPYTDVAETKKYVPNYVSLRTYMTAIKNRRSLIYTEELHKGTSKYGMTYQQGNRRAYYGQVCSGFTAWVMGLRTIYLSQYYQSNTVPGLSTVTGGNSSNVRPLDLLWWDGHVAIVSAVFLDEFNNRKYIEISEMTSPYPYRTMYTLEQFDSRMSTGEIHRWNGWENLPEPDEARDLSQYILGDVRQEIQYNPDIMCFAGDYAAFAEGDIIHLNARRNSVYTGVELYKNDVLLQTIDITGLSADTIVSSNTEDWVDVNLTTLNLTYGKYKARLTDGTNTTDYTYFEVIDITFSATKSGSTVTAYFSSNEGTPVSLERVKANGFGNAYKQITAEMVTAGETTAWQAVSGYPYLVLLVDGDYGTALKRISIPT